MTRSREKRCRRTSSRDMAPSRSCTLAAVTTTVRTSPRVSTRICRLRPLMFWAYRSRGPPFFGGLHGLTIDDPGTRLAPLPSGHADITAEQVMHQLPSPIVAPAPKILIDDLPGREIMGQQAPSTATTQDIEDGVQDFTFGLLLGAAPRLGCGHIGGDQRPFLVSKVGRIRFAGCHAPMVTPCMWQLQAY